MRDEVQGGGGDDKGRCVCDSFGLLVTKIAQ